MRPDYFNSDDEAEFCKREIEKLTLANCIVESCLESNTEYPHSALSEFSYDNIENLTYVDTESYSFNEFMEDSSDELKDRSKDYQITAYNKCLQDEYHETKEVFQWYIVDEWQANKLREIDQPLLFAGNLHFWGRTCCGQSIVLDGTFQEIYRSIEK